MFHGHFNPQNRRVAGKKEYLQTESQKHHKKSFQQNIISQGGKKGEKVWIPLQHFCVLLGCQLVSDVGAQESLSGNTHILFEAILAFHWVKNHMTQDSHFIGSIQIPVEHTEMLQESPDLILIIHVCIWPYPSYHLRSIPEEVRHACLDQANCLQNNDECGVIMTRLSAHAQCYCRGNQPNRGTRVVPPLGPYQQQPRSQAELSLNKNHLVLIVSGRGEEPRKQKQRFVIQLITP